MTSAFSRLPAALRDLHGFGILRDLDVYMTETLARRYEATDAADYTILACALASRDVGNSHVCLDLSQISTDWLAALAADDNLAAASLSEQTEALSREPNRPRCRCF